MKRKIRTKASVPERKLKT